MSAKPPQCSATVYGPRVQSWTCQRAASVQRNGKWYCRQHDPVVRKAKDEARRAEWDAKAKASDDIHAEAERIAERLGCGVPHYGLNGITRAIVVSFDEAERLIRQLSSSSLDTSTERMTFEDLRDMALNGLVGSVQVKDHMLRQLADHLDALRSSLDTGKAEKCENCNAVAPDGEGPCYLPKDHPMPHENGYILWNTPKSLDTGKEQG